MQQVFRAFGRLSATGLLVMALAACSGGGGSDPGYNAPPGFVTATISGAVTGATFVAVDAASNAETGRVAATTTAGGQKSFSLPLPPNKTYKFYLIENEGTAYARVFPVYQGTVNKFSVSAITTIDLGFVDTSTGVALPDKDMTRVAGVKSSGEDATVPGNLRAAAFTAADLAGTWNVLQLSGGTNSQWMRSVVTIDANGEAPATEYVSSTGTGITAPATYSIQPSGVVSLQGGITGDFRAVMSKDKSMVIGTFSPNPGEPALFVMLKGGAAYAAADLEGTWKYSELIAGPASAWGRGDAAIDAAGVMTVSNAGRSAGSGDPAGTLAVDPSGVISNSASAAFYGILSKDRNLMVALDTEADGGVALLVLSRSSGAGFSTADLRGTWRMNWLSAGNSGTASSNLGRALFVSDTSGDAEMTSIDLGFARQNDVALTASVTSAGGMEFEQTNFFGIISIGKGLIIGTETGANGIPGLYAFMK